MGEFSYICKECNKPINADEACIFFLLVKGKVVEFQKGFNNNYGAVIDIEEGINDYIRWTYDDWISLVDLHFNKDEGSGFAVFHQKCYKGVLPTTISKDDPEQGWGGKQDKHRYEEPYNFCKVCFAKVPIGKCCEKSQECKRQGLADEV